MDMIKYVAVAAALDKLYKDAYTVLYALNLSARDNFDARMRNEQGRSRKRRCENE